MNSKQLVWFRLKFGVNPYGQTFTCSVCHDTSKNDPREESLFARVEINGEIMDFSLCPACVKQGLFKSPDKELAEAQFRLTLGYTEGGHEHTCSFCHTTFPPQKSLFAELEINGKVMGFPICPKCIRHGLFETMGSQTPKEIAAHPIGLA